MNPSRSAVPHITGNTGQMEISLTTARRRKLSAEDNDKIIAAVLAGEKTYSEISRDLRVSKSTIAKAARRASVKRIGGRRRKAPPTEKSHWFAIAGTTPRIEAIGLYKLSLCPGQGVERIREGILVPDSDQENLRRVMPASEVHGLVSYRQEILNEFNKLVSCPPPGLVGKLARARVALRERYTVPVAHRRADVLRG